MVGRLINTLEDGGNCFSTIWIFTQDNSWVSIWLIDIVGKFFGIAIWDRTIDNGLILFTDLGSQYTSNE